MPDRKYPVGAEPDADGVDFRVWAPDRQRVAVVFKDESKHEMHSDGDGYFQCRVREARALDLYRFQLDDSELLPDPASRFQPEGPHGPSQIIDFDAYDWTDQKWPGRTLRGAVVYELHIGTFTNEGSWAAATRELPELAELGVNCIEVMPVSEFCGSFGWGYDGVNLFAPSHLYGTPDEFRRFVNRAHFLGIAVVLDVVYNHFGPDGNYLDRYAKSYFTDRYQTDWGSAINFGGVNSTPVREYFLTNAAYWIAEFHLDGLRLDATQNIYDEAPPRWHILTQIGESARAAAKGRSIVLFAENEPQHSELCHSISDGGYGLDALWNDDYHHSAVVALAGRREAYYTDYFGNPQEFISSAKYGYLYQGQWYSWQKKRRGRPGLDLPLPAFINFIQNHDQIANSGRGLRIHQQTSPGLYRTLTALTLLTPGTPMLFQGQEFAASTPFLFFADHQPELAAMVEAGRKEFLSQFPSLKDQRITSQIAAPHDPETFRRCKLDSSERSTHAAEYQLTKDLLRLRQSTPGFQPPHRGIDGAVIGPNAFVLRYFFPHGLDRLLVINLGRDIDLSSAPEPLLAPPPNQRWEMLLSTEDPQYGGSGIRALKQEDAGWFISGEVALVLGAVPAT